MRIAIRHLGFATQDNPDMPTWDPKDGFDEGMLNHPTTRRWRTIKRATLEAVMENANPYPPMRS